MVHESFPLNAAIYTVDSTSPYGDVSSGINIRLFARPLNPAPDRQTDRPACACARPETTSKGRQENPSSIKMHPVIIEDIGCSVNGYISTAPLGAGG